MYELGLILFFLLLGFGIGKHGERRHYLSIAKREEEHLNIPVVSFEKPPDDRTVAEARLATGCVVVSIDYYKRFLAGMRMFFGGELSSYASLIDRARREAVLRMRESCPEAHLFLNCRMETSSISKGKQKAVGPVEVFAYATAIIYADEIRS